ncbi:MAG: serine/threonine protein kinase [Magnetococcales bacterium]|nr:serine/threonine protein kinase [Magnetococcales bacterium]
MASQIQKPLKKGVVLNECEILKVLGIGAFGITYLAYDKLLDRKVAIKEFFPRDFATRNKKQHVVPKQNSDPELFKWGLERFFLEGRTLAKFKHVSIVGVVRIFRELGSAYLIMDFEPGLSLGEHIKKQQQSLFQAKRNFTKDEIFKIIRYLSGGLKAIHATGIIHRDIKPDNIIIRDNGVPVLLDFGAARQAILEKNAQLTVMATPAYAPPEQFLQDGNQGPWTDIFAMGAVLYQMIGGEKPLDAGARLLATSANKPDPYIPAKQIGRGKFPKEFLHAIDEALLIDQSKRPKSIDDWLKMMRTVDKPIVGHNTETVLAQKNSINQASNFGDKNVTSSGGHSPSCKKCVFIAVVVFLVLQPFIIMAYNHLQPIILEKISDDNKKTKKSAENTEHLLSTKPIQRAYKETKNFVSQIISPTQKANKFSLTIKTKPAKARIRILNILPQFKQGMALVPENYHIEISHTGYKTKKMWIKIKNRDRVLNIELIKQHN